MHTKESGTEPHRASGLSPKEDVVDQAKELAETIGQTVNSAAETIRRTKQHAGAAMDTIADGIAHSTEYLTEQGIEGVVKDAETLIRRYPIHALILGVSVGYLLSRSRRG